jgi:hypothetical protein
VATLVKSYFRKVLRGVTHPCKGRAYPHGEDLGF